MKRTFRFPYAKTTLLVTVLAAAGLYAAVTFNPATQPAMTVSPYTLQTTNLAEVGVEGTRAYRTWYENGASIHGAVQIQYVPTIAWRWAVHHHTCTA